MRNLIAAILIGGLGPFPTHAAVLNQLTGVWQYLKQKVTWLNPANHVECSKDPDMRLGLETESRFLIQNEELHFFFDLNGKEFIYILRAVAQ